MAAGPAASLASDLCRASRRARLSEPSGQDRDPVCARRTDRVHPAALPGGSPTATLGQAFIIENRPGGAGGMVGAKSVAVAEPDGYTLLFNSAGPLVTAAAIYKNLDYDPIKSFAPIAMVIYAPQMLAVHP